MSFYTYVFPRWSLKGEISNSNLFRLCNRTFFQTFFLLIFSFLLLAKLSSFWESFCYDIFQVDESYEYFRFSHKSFEEQLWDEIQMKMSARRRLYKGTTFQWCRINYSFVSHLSRVFKYRRLKSGFWPNEYFFSQFHPSRLSVALGWPENRVTKNFKYFIHSSILLYVYTFKTMPQIVCNNIVYLWNVSAYWKLKNRFSPFSSQFS